MKRRSGIVEFAAPWQISDQLDTDPFVSFAWPRPDFNGACHEFLIGLLSTVEIIEDEDDWRTYWLHPPSPTELQKAFQQIESAFELHGHKYCFMQDAGILDKPKEVRIDALLVDTPGQQTLTLNTDHFVKRRETFALGRSSAAMALYTLQTYAPSGGAGHRTSLRGGGPLTTLLVFDTQQRTLWSRIWPNVESSEQIQARSVDGFRQRKLERIFPWMGETRVSNSSGRTTTPDVVDPLIVYWSMPRRIQLAFNVDDDQRCSLLNRPEKITSSKYHTQNYGNNYPAESFQHPLTPYYRKHPNDVECLPIHAQPSGISYRDWPGLIISSQDDKGLPAKTISHGLRERIHTGSRKLSYLNGLRIAAFGFDMDNMKPRAWVEVEHPLIVIPQHLLDVLAPLINRIVEGTLTASNMLVDAIKSALCRVKSHTKIDSSVIRDRTFQETEAMFHKVLNEICLKIQSLDSDSFEETINQSLKQWTRLLMPKIISLFDEYAPDQDLEYRDMRPHVLARNDLQMSLLGFGNKGRKYFEKSMKIAAPEPKSKQSR